MTKPNLKCYICQKPIYRIPSKWNGHNVCSYACRNKYYSKEKSFAYKHGKCVMDKNGKAGRNEERDRTRDKLRRIAFKIKAINYLGGKCQICGYDKCIASLDFHHKDPKLKNKSIKDLSLGSWEKYKKNWINVYYCVLIVIENYIGMKGMDQNLEKKLMNTYPLMFQRRNKTKII